MALLRLRLRGNGGSGTEIAGGDDNQAFGVETARNGGIDLGRSESVDFVIEVTFPRHGAIQVPEVGEGAGERGVAAATNFAGLEIARAGALLVREFFSAAASRREPSG